VTYAPAWKRIVAFLLDMALMAVVVVLTQSLLGPLLGIGFFKGDISGWALEGYALLTVSLPTWAYFIFFERRFQATPGKMLLRLMVTDDDGHPLRFPRLVLRTAVKMFPVETAYLTFLIPVPMISEQGRGEFRIGAVAVVGMIFVYLLMMTWNDARQSMHDLIAESCVIDRGRPLRLFRRRKS
jgi:uncharacterized RDD family membrane protein YckC